MAANPKAVGAVLVGAGLLGAFAFQGAARAASEPAKAPKPPKPSAKVSRVALTVKWARVFGVPPSLVLATTYAQSGNRVNAIKQNKRGGAWGYGQMTLATAKEIWPRFKGKIGLDWDGTGKGLLDPSLNLALTAAFLSLWWNRYKSNPSGWILTGYAYILGPGRVRQVLPNDKGKLPKPLPSDFARVRKAYAQAIAQAEVKKALNQESTKANLGAEYKSSDPLVWTPAAVKAEFDRVRTVLDIINKEMSQAVKDGKMTGDEWKDWFNVYNTGHKFVDTASKYWGSNVITARQHEQEAAKWRDLIKARGGKLTGPQELIRPADKPLLDQLTAPGLNKVSAAIAVGGIVGLGVLILAIKK